MAIFIAENWIPPGCTGGNLAEEFFSDPKNVGDSVGDDEAVMPEASTS